MTVLHVHVPDEVADRLAAEAAQRGTSVEDVAAELIAEHAPTPPGPRRLGFVALGRSGRSDISDRAEELLRAEFGA